MSEFNKKSESINTNTHIDESMTRRILIVAFGLIETLLGFRFIFKLAGANPVNTLIKVLYDVTNVFVGVFASIFTPATTDGLETVSVIEPGTIIAMIVFALIALAISKLIAQDKSTHKNTTEYSTVDHNLSDGKEKI
jgi:hypothetical protein